ncbi:VOC family protein [Thalassotalea sp. Y01]|uniref:VOC family protein n=1 Tax=Thalassotalea sp. Y01 TaxID=2729613 RepID=UPI00145F0AF4|nr:VOC family protein [Thalassotalea sp. Y01]NMP17434.1 VOC family protein [Thalassotalea sp. Y01]
MSLHINAIGQVAICCTDINAARAFYQDIMGLPLLFDAGENLSFYQLNDIRLMLTTLQGEERDHHTSVIYYKVDDIEQAFAHLQQHNVAIERAPALAATMSDHQLWIGFIRDPSDNLVGIMSEKPLSD